MELIYFQSIFGRDFPLLAAAHCLPGENQDSGSDHHPRFPISVYCVYVFSRRIRSFISVPFRSFSRSFKYVAAHPRSTLASSIHHLLIRSGPHLASLEHHITSRTTRRRRRTDPQSRSIEFIHPWTVDTVAATATVRQPGARNKGVRIRLSDGTERLPEREHLGQAHERRVPPELDAH